MSCSVCAELCDLDPLCLSKSLSHQEPARSIRTHLESSGLVKRSERRGSEGDNTSAELGNKSLSINVKIYILPSWAIYIYI